MRLTIIHPCIGRKPGQKYIRTWQMEALRLPRSPALTPADVEIRFYDDRMEQIPFDEATDLVAISVETYTAKRAYQIATEYRKRHVPVVMGGFHATLCPMKPRNMRKPLFAAKLNSLAARPRRCPSRAVGKILSPDRPPLTREFESPTARFFATSVTCPLV